MSGTPDEEVDYGSSGSNANSSIISVQIMNGVHRGIIVNTK